VGAALEQLLLAEWGAPLLDRAPNLSRHELTATEEGAL
jgi:aspartyl-tRNA(Asn)/glutamyl-tRNA(Gln) amidotransferase subunit A